MSPEGVRVSVCRLSEEGGLIVTGGCHPTPEQNKKAEGGTTCPLPELGLRPSCPWASAPCFSDSAVGLNDSTRPPSSPALRPQALGRLGHHHHVSKFHAIKKYIRDRFLFGGKPYYNIQWKDILTPATAWVELGEIVLCEISQTQKARDCTNPVTGGPWRSRIHRDRRRVGAGGGRTRTRVSVQWRQSSSLGSSRHSGGDGCTIL